MSRSVSDVSVVTVNWNGRAHLTSLLESLVPLGCREIILVDNASTDGSVAFVQQHFPQVRILENPTNLGFAQPCNLGASHARGRYVALINNDMRADAHWLEAGLARLDAETPCVASRILNWEGTHIDFNGSSLQYLGYALQRDIGEIASSVSHDGLVLFPCGGAMLVDRDYFLEIGGFDEEFFAVFEDVDLGWRIWVTGQQVALAPASLVYHRGHATFSRYQNEKLRYLMHRNALLLILKNYEDETLQKVLPAAILLALKRAVLFSGVRKEAFYLWENTRQELRWQDRAFQNRLLDSLNHLVSLDDALESLPRLLEKRQKIQGSRSRRDSEMVSLFGDPVRTIVEDPGYLYQEHLLFQLLDLTPLLGPLPPEDKLFSQWPTQLQERLQQLRHELIAQQWLNSAASQTASSPAVPGPRKFLRVWRTSGFRSAWSSFLEHVNRGI